MKKERDIARNVTLEMERTIQSINEILIKEKMKAKELELELKMIKEVMNTRNKELEAYNIKFLEKDKELEIFKRQLKILEDNLKQMNTLKEESNVLQELNTEVILDYRL